MHLSNQLLCCPPDTAGRKKSGVRRQNGKRGTERWLELVDMPFCHVFCEDAPRGAMTGFLREKASHPQAANASYSLSPAREQKEGEKEGVCTMDVL